MWAYKRRYDVCHVSSKSRKSRKIHIRVNYQLEISDASITFKYFDCFDKVWPGLCAQRPMSVSGLDHKSIVAMSQLCTEAELQHVETVETLMQRVWNCALCESIRVQHRKKCPISFCNFFCCMLTDSLSFRLADGQADLEPSKHSCTEWFCMILQLSCLTNYMLVSQLGSAWPRQSRI